MQRDEDPAQEPGAGEDAEVTPTDPLMMDAETADDDTESPDYDAAIEDCLSWSCEEQTPRQTVAQGNGSVFARSNRHTTLLRVGAAPPSAHMRSHKYRVLLGPYQ